MVSIRVYEKIQLVEKLMDWLFALYTKMCWYDTKAPQDGEHWNGSFLGKRISIHLEALQHVLF